LAGWKLSDGRSGAGADKLEGEMLGIGKHSAIDFTRLHHPVFSTFNNDASWFNSGGRPPFCGLIATWFFVDDLDGILLETDAFGHASINDPACLRMG
jgi:hypothetical protein